MRSCFDKTLVWIAIYQLCVCTLFFILSCSCVQNLLQSVAQFQFRTNLLHFSHTSKLVHARSTVTVYIVLIRLAIYQLWVCTLFFIFSSLLHSFSFIQNLLHFSKHNSKLVQALHCSSLQSDKNLGSRECRHLVMGHLYTARAIIINNVAIIMK